MSYRVLARTYRPQNFDDLVGQEPVTRTLQNALRTGRLAHAFLFTGERGVGKTTCARLLAKCLNCVGPDGSWTSPTPTPCQQCSPCREITAGIDLDVQEIDGASYNGIDEVRRLQEGVLFQPARDRFKVYIVDEVHMLSNAAWNAFLKTLEEPPPHAKFLFATTEAHKVPATILSRCQRYDFTLLETEVVEKRLRTVLASEQIEAEDSAVVLLAREAAGSMRDAMSLLDQVIAFAGSPLTLHDVTRVLGVADRTVLYALGEALVDGEPAKALEILASLSGQGVDLTHLAKDLFRHLRHLVVAKVCGESGKRLLGLPDEEMRDLFALAGRTELDDCMRLFQGFSQSFDDIVRSGQPRIALEMTLVRLARRPPLLPLEGLLQRLAELEQRLLGGTPLLPHRDRGKTSPPPPSASVSPLPVATQRAAVRAQASKPPAAPSSLPVPPQTASASVPDPLQERWGALLRRMEASHPALAAVYAHALPVPHSATEIRLRYASDSVLCAQAAAPEALAILGRVAQESGTGPITFSVDSGMNNPEGLSVAARERTQAAENLEHAKAVLRAHPLVQEVRTLFGAEPTFQGVQGAPPSE